MHCDENYISSRQEIHNFGQAIWCSLFNHSWSQKLNQSVRKFTRDFFGAEYAFRRSTCSLLSWWLITYYAFRFAGITSYLPHPLSPLLLSYPWSFGSPQPSSCPSGQCSWEGSQMQRALQGWDFNIIKMEEIGFKSRTFLPDMFTPHLELSGNEPKGENISTMGVPATWVNTEQSLKTQNTDYCGC